MHEITNLCPKANIVKVVDGIATNQAAQEAASTLFQTNPDVKVVLCFNGEGCLGVNEYAMSSGNVEKVNSQRLELTGQIRLQKKYINL